MTKVNKDKIKKQIDDSKGKRLDVALILPTKWKKKLKDKIVRKA